MVAYLCFCTVIEWVFRVVDPETAEWILVCEIAICSGDNRAVATCRLAVCFVWRRRYWSGVVVALVGGGDIALAGCILGFNDGEVYRYDDHDEGDDKDTSSNEDPFRPTGATGV